MTIREFVLVQSTLPSGNTVREHIKHGFSSAGQIVKDLDGVVMTQEELLGEITTFNLIGEINE